MISLAQSYSSLVSFDEFKAMFRKNANSKKEQLFDAGDDGAEDAGNLVGLDAKIPGGKYDASS